MRFIHCADIHLGSKLSSTFPKEIADERRRELLSAFDRMISYAKNNDVRAILLSGDVFDKDKPTQKDKQFFYKAIMRNPEIDFLYLNGNHDKEGSYTVEDIPNLKTFNKTDFTSYEYDNVVISGIEISNENCEAFYSKLSLDKQKLNIVMLHGDDCDSMGMDKVRISELKGKGIDYLALGHIHSYKTGRIDDRGIYAFSGCLEGRGFDECGEKGFVLLEVTDTVKHTFVPFAERTIHDLKIDVTGAHDLYEVSETVKEKVHGIDKKDLLHIELTGELSPEIQLDGKDIEKLLSQHYFVRVKNKCTLLINAEDYKDDTSLIGEFIRGTTANEQYDDERKKKIITLGLALLSGKEADR